MTFEKFEPPHDWDRARWDSETGTCLQCFAKADPRIGGDPAREIKMGVYFGYDHSFGSLQCWICNDCLNELRSGAFEVVDPV